MVGNVIVGQSGGPTAVINSSLAGVFKTAKDRGAKKVYGMRHGIKGLLDRQYVDLSEKIKTDIDIDLLKRTPSSYLGSCRYKLPEISEGKETYEKIFEILNELDIKYFFYIGGKTQWILLRSYPIMVFLSTVTSNSWVFQRLLIMILPLLTTHLDLVVLQSLLPQQ